MRKMLFPWMAFILLGGSVPVYSTGAERVVFADDFTTSALMMEMWKTTPSDGWKMEDGVFRLMKAGPASATPRGLDRAEPVAVTFRIRVRDFGKGNNWVGARVRGIHFTLTPEGFWHVYNSPAQERALGGIQKKGIALNHWYDFRIEHDGDRYRWLVDGEVVADFREPNPVNGADQLVALATSGPQADYASLAVYALADTGDLSPNFIRNASFETVYDIVPYGWKPSGISTIPQVRFWSRWGVDTNTFWHGRQSLRVVSAEHDSAGVMCHQAGMPVGRPCTFSIYLKADRPDLLARLMYFEYPAGPWKHQEVRVGTDWERFTFTIDSPSNRNVRVGAQVMSGQAGTLWVDAAQLEVGTEATPFEPAYSDTPSAMEDADSETARIPKDRAVTEADVAPVVDGRLDDSVWTDATRTWPLLLPGGGTPQEATEAWMVVSGDTLYLAFKCHDSRMDQLKAEVTEHDGPVYGDDCVEVFVDTHRDGGAYYHLVVNPLGTRFDAGPGRNISWNHAWTAAVHRAETYWSVEIALPLSTFSPSPEQAGTWGVNFCRGNHKAGEYSSTALPSTPNFHVPHLFPGLTLPDDTLRALRVVPEALSLMQTADGGLRLTGRLVNRTGEARQVRLVSGDPGMSWTSPPVDVPAGQSVPVEVADFPGSADLPEVRVHGCVRDSGGAALPRHAFTVMLPVERVMDGRFERTFYSLEPAAHVQVRIALPPDVLAASTLTWRLDGEATSLTGIEQGGAIRLAVPLEGVPPGEHPVDVVLTDKEGQELARIDTVLDRRPPMRNAVSIDRISRAVVADGRPFFVFAPLVHIFPHTSPEHIDRVINHFADAGFRSIMVVGRLEIAPENWGRVFDRCRDRHVRLIVWPGGFSGKQDNAIFRPFIERWRDHPALLAWLPVDEPELYASPESARETIEFFQRLDPHHPVYVNNTVMGIPSRFAGLPGDILSIDDYLTNREGRTVSEILHQVDIMEQAARPTQRPSWIFLVGNNLYNHNREPTAAEQVAQSYGSAIAGATGLVYFMGDPVDRGHWRQMKQLNREFSVLESVLLSSTPAPEAVCSAGAIRFTTRRVGSEVYLIAVNSEDRPVEATFIVSGLGSREGVQLFEEQVVAFTDDSLKTQFAPHARQVYRVSLPE